MTVFVKSKCKRYEIQTNIPSRKQGGPGMELCIQIISVLAKVCADEFRKL